MKLRLWAVFALFVCGALLGTGLLGSGVLAQRPAAAGPAASMVASRQFETTMTWKLTVNAREDRLEGTLFFNPPQALSYQYDWLPRRDLYYDGITASYQQGRVEYSYETSQLFSVLEELYLPLLTIKDVPGSWLGEERVGGRVVSVYQQDGPMGGRFWFDQQTGLPLQAEIGNRRYLTLVQYQPGMEAIGEPATAELRWTRDEFTGSLDLIRVYESWLPQRLVVADDMFTLELIFGVWEILPGPMDMGRLPRLADHIQAAEAARAGQDWDASMYHYREVLRIDPYYAPAYFYLGYGYGLQGEFPRVVEHYQQWLMLMPDHPMALNNLAYTYMLQEVRLQEALQLARRAVDRDRNPAYLDTLGYGYYLLGEYNLALRYLEEALAEIAPEMRGEVLQHLILVHKALGNEEQVLQYRRQLDNEHE